MKNCDLNTKQQINKAIQELINIKKDTKVSNLALLPLKVNCVIERLENCAINLQEIAERINKHQKNKTMTTGKYISENKTNTFQKSDKVIMHNCAEADFPENQEKVWTCQTDSYLDKGKQEVVFLEGFSGCFMVKYLKPSNTNSVVDLEIDELLNRVIDDNIAVYMASLKGLQEGEATRIETTVRDFCQHAIELYKSNLDQNSELTEMIRIRISRNEK